jgi:hypothetical protein
MNHAVSTIRNCQRSAARLWLWLSIPGGWEIDSHWGGGVGRLWLAAYAHELELPVAEVLSSPVSDTRKDAPFEHARGEP